MLTVTTWNVNGIRARVGDVLSWIDQRRPDVLALQEVKASPEQVPAALCDLEGYWCYWHGHKGYSGVALLFSREKFPVRPVFEHPEFDHETRIVTARVGTTVFASIYVPNGGKDFPAKVRFLIALQAFVEKSHAAGHQLVLVGDLNVAREERDVHPTLRNSREIGQTSGEREQLERIIGGGLVDLGRRFHPENDQLFTWWAPWRKMRERNIGWRLDYVLSTNAFAEHAVGCEVFPEFGMSDHAPVLATFDVAAPQPSPDDSEQGETPASVPRREENDGSGVENGGGQMKLF